MSHVTNAAHQVVNGLHALNASLDSASSAMANVAHHLQSVEKVVDESAKVQRQIAEDNAKQARQMMEYTFWMTVAAGVSAFGALAGLVVALVR